MAAKVPEAEDLNLTPIMNCVLVLIPLMLLNVVFMKISIINVTMPQRSAGAAQTSGDPPFRLQLFISDQGFTIVKGQETLPGEGDCTGGPTICLANPDAELATDRYDWLALYNKLLDVKWDPECQKANHDTIEIVGDSNVNFGTLIKAMDIARNQLVPSGDNADAEKGKKLGSVEELNNARAPLTTTTNEAGETVKTPLAMFPAVVLGLPNLSQ